MQKLMLFNMQSLNGDLTSLVLSSTLLVKMVFRLKRIQVEMYALEMHNT